MLELATCKQVLIVVMKFIVGVMFLTIVSLAYADPKPSPWFTHDAGNQVQMNVDLFLASTCSHCHKADIFFRNIEKNNPWLIVHRYIINQDKPALQTFYEHLQQQHSSDFSVPTVFFCNSRWVGFAEAKTTGKALLNALTYCHQKISQQGELSAATVNVLQKQSLVSPYQGSTKIMQSTFMLPITAQMNVLILYSLVCFVAFLAFLWLYPARKWRQFGIRLIFLFGFIFIGWLILK